MQQSMKYKESLSASSTLFAFITDYKTQSTKTFTTCFTHFSLYLNNNQTTKQLDPLKLKFFLCFDSGSDIPILYMIIIMQNKF